ncbi:MAG: ABC transporter permease [Blastocatellia bacterium]
METLFQDLRYGVRMLTKKPGFTVVVVMTLALGIGASTAIFSVVNTVLLRPLPYKDAEQIAVVWETLPSIGLEENTPAPANYINWREQNEVFENIAAFTVGFTNLTGTGEPERVDSLRVSASIFPLLGVEPMLGRTFLPEEDQPGASRVVVISHSLWQRRFGRDPDILEKTITVNDRSYTVIGVMGPSFSFPLLKAELWVPIAFTADARTEMSRNLWVLGRMKPGVTRDQAQAEMDTIVARGQDPQATFRFGVNVVPLGQQLVGHIRPALIVLLAATGFVLLIACVNVANLLLARANGRQKEIAVRCALGAGRWRLMRQLLTESLMLAGLGGAAALLLAMWGVDILSSVMPDNLSQAKSVFIDARVFAFTLAVSLVTGIVFGIVPALQATKPNMNEALKEGGRDSSGSRRWVRNLLVVTEVALALVLLIGAGLMIKSFQRLNNVDMGFQPANLLAMQVQLSSSRYGEQNKRTAFFDQLLEQIEALPGVESAAVINGLPVSFQGGGSTFKIEGRAEAQSTTPMCTYRIISPDYFRTLGIPLLSGRDFSRSDSEPCAIISESLARRVWPDGDALGQRIKWAGDDSPRLIVGIVKDVKLSLTAEVKPHVYMPYSQIEIAPYEMVIRTKTDGAGLSAAIRSEVWAIDKDQPVSNIRTMEQILSGSIARQRFNLLLLGIFAALAMALASVGIYGVMSYTVTQNTREIGIRMALGARAGDVLKLVVGQGLALTFIGVGIGIGAAFALTRLMASLLFEVRATDPATFVLYSAILTGVALGACFIPARRATKVDPMVALRYE